MQSRRFLTRKVHKNYLQTGFEKALKIHYRGTLIPRDFKFDKKIMQALWMFASEEASYKSTSEGIRGALNKIYYLFCTLTLAELKFGTNIRHGS